MTDTPLANPDSHPPCDVHDEIDPMDRMLRCVDLPAARANVTLTSGRRVELSAEGEHDCIVVRATDGRVVLDIHVTDAGPRLSFESAELELRAAKRLSVAAQDVEVHATSTLTLAAGGDVHERCGGHHHRRVGGEERLEAARIQMQANHGGVAVRAVEAIALDGEHIALNDDPCPEPFSWSGIPETLEHEP